MSDFSFLRLIRDVTNPKPDRRKTSWDYAPVWTAGTLLVRRDWMASIWAGDDKPEIQVKMFDLRPVGSDYSRLSSRFEKEEGACRLLMAASESIDLDTLSPNDAALAIITAENIRSDAILRILIERGMKPSELFRALSERGCLRQPIV